MRKLVLLFAIGCDLGNHFRHKVVLTSNFIS